jgi:hypothetical protein
MTLHRGLNMPTLVLQATSLKLWAFLVVDMAVLRQQATDRSVVCSKYCHRSACTSLNCRHTAASKKNSRRFHHDRGVALPWITVRFEAMAAAQGDKQSHGPAEG